MTAPTTAEELSKRLPLGRGVRVVATGPGGLLALEKPAGILTHPNAGGASAGALLQAAYDHGRECYHWKAEGARAAGTLFLLNRLDSPTSGLVLAALNAETAAAGRRAFAEGGAKKTYFALVVGRVRPPQGEWTDRLARELKDGKGVRMRAGAGGEGLTAITRYRAMEFRGDDGPGLTLLKLEPVTGRTHQLRVQCAWHQHPIVGDATYGNFGYNRAFAKKTGRKRLLLHAAAVKLPGLHFAAESPVPGEFAKVRA